MKLHIRCVAVVIASMLLLPAPASAQMYGGGNSGNFGLGSALAGIAVAALAVTLGVVYIKHRQRTVAGCVRPAEGHNVLVDERDHRGYVLLGAAANQIEPGRRLRLKGSRVNAADGTLAFRVDETVTDLGVCN
jgi:hypothetical protein